MAESTLSLALTDLEAEVGAFLGFGRGANFSETAWTARQQQQITVHVKAGLRAFYFPAPLPGDSASYDWSFLRPVRQLTLASGAKTVDLPDDFGGLEGDVRLVDSGRLSIPVRQTNEQQVAQRYFALPDQTGQPEWCAVRTGTTVGAAKGTRASLYVFPAADQAYTLEFQMYLLPDSLTATFAYPLGGAVHAETIKAACLMKAELDSDNQPGPMMANFLDRMRASVSLDRRNKPQTLGYNADPGYGRARYPTGWRHYDQQGTITFAGVSPG